MTTPQTGDLCAWLTTAVTLRDWSATLRHLVKGVAECCHPADNSASLSAVILAERLRPGSGTFTLHVGFADETSTHTSDANGANTAETLLQVCRDHGWLPADREWSSLAVQEFGEIGVAVFCHAMPTDQQSAASQELPEAWRNAMFALLERLLADRAAAREQAVVEQNSRLQALAEFAAGAGHEINNPLASITGRAQLLLRDEPSPARRQSLATIGAQALRIRDMIGDCMLFARPPAPQPVPLNVHEHLQSAIDQQPAGEMNCTLAGPADVQIMADPTQFAVVMHALLRNSFEAGAKQVSLRVETVDATSSSTAEHGKFVTIRITDDGCGLSDLERTHLFDPFFSGRQAGRGLGFGLSKAWRIVTLHGGAIRVATPEQGGCQLEIDWPAV